MAEGKTSGKTTGKRSGESRLKEKQGLLLLHLIAAPDGAARQKDLTDRKIPCEPEVRGPLERRGLVATRRQGRGNVIEATDKGWNEAGAALADLLPEDAEGGGAVLRAWLGRFGAFLARQDKALADLMATSPLAPDEAARPATPPDAPAHAPAAIPAGAETKGLSPDAAAALHGRIRAAYLAATGGQLNVRALLKDLRPHLADVPRATLDAALIALQREGGAVLHRLDNGAALTPADRDAALTIAGEPRHILWISK